MASYRIVLVGILCFSFLSACTIISGQLLPETEIPKITKSSRKVYLTFNAVTDRNEREQISKIFTDSHLFEVVEAEPLKRSPDNNNVKNFDDLFPESEACDSCDFTFEIALKRLPRSFEIPAISVLSACFFPCWRDLRWALGIRVKRRDGEIIKDYLVKEDATATTWLLGFILKDSGAPNEKPLEVLRNSFNNIFVQMDKDGFL